MTIVEHLRRNIILAFPVMVGQLGHIMVSVADTAMVGHLGVIPLAGITFAGTIYYLLKLFGIGVSYAITPLVAATDPGDRKTLLGYLQSACLLNFVLGLALFGIGFGLSPFLDYFGQDPRVVEAARGYLIIVSLSLLPLMMFQTFRQYAEGLSDTMNPMIVSILANVINVVLNYLLIFGKMGFPAMGIMGAAYATLIARTIMVLLIVGLLHHRCRGFSFIFYWDKIRDMLRLGLPSGLQYVFEVGAFAMSAIMVGWIGPEALAAHQIALNLSAITYMAATGIAAAATIRIGNQMGLRDIRNLRIAGYSCFAIVAVFMGGCAIIFVVFRYQLTGLYIDDPYVRDLASLLLIIAAAFQISDGLQAVGLGVLRGLKDVKVPTMVTFIAYWLVAIPGAYVLGFVFDLGTQGVWLALFGGLTVAAVLHILRFKMKLTQIRF